MHPNKVAAEPVGEVQCLWCTLNKALLLGILMYIYSKIHSCARERESRTLDTTTTYDYLCMISCLVFVSRPSCGTQPVRLKIEQNIRRFKDSEQQFTLLCHLW